MSPKSSVIYRWDSKRELEINARHKGQCQLIGLIYSLSCSLYIYLLKPVIFKRLCHPQFFLKMRVGVMRDVRFNEVIKKFFHVQLCPI